MTQATHFWLTNPHSLSFVPDLYSVFFKVGISECCLNYSVENSRMCVSRDIGFHEEVEIKPRASVVVESPWRWWVHCWRLLILCFRRELHLQGRTGLYQRTRCYKLLSSFKSLYVVYQWRSEVPRHVFLYMCEKVKKEYLRNDLLHDFTSLDSLGNELCKWNAFLAFCRYSVSPIICFMAVAYAGEDLSSQIRMSL